jgi:hypothetical protein
VFSMTFDRAFGIGVGVFSGPVNTAEDYERYCDAVKRLDELATTVPVPAFALVLDRDSPRPDAVWRKRLAHARDGLRSKPLVALVTESALLRGAIQAAQWISPRPFPFVVVERFDEAAAWIDGHRPGVSVLLTKLYQELRDGTGRSLREIV